MGPDSIGKRASARWAYPHNLSDVRAEGTVIAYCAAPQVCIQTDDGEQIWWRADLTVPHESDRTAARTPPSNEVTPGAIDDANGPQNGSDAANRPAKGDQQ